MMNEKVCSFNTVTSTLNLLSYVKFLLFFTRYMKTTASPSWSEFWNFIKFLSFQLQDCERSYYTNPEIVSDSSLKGFKEFIVNS